MPTSSISILPRFSGVGVYLLALPAGLSVLAFLGLRWLPKPPAYVDSLAIVLPWLIFPVGAALLLALAAHARPAALLCALSGGLLLALYGPYYLPGKPDRASGPVFTVMTYNVLWSAPSPEQVLAQVAAQTPDLVAFQEFQPPKSRAVTAALAQQYPYHDIQGTYGLFSRYPLSACQVIPDRDQDSYLAQRCQVELDGRTLTVFNVHLRTPSVHAVQLPWLNQPLYLGVGPARRDGDLDLLLAQADHAAETQLVLGDFNLTDQAPAYARLRARWGDAYRSASWGMGFSFRRLGLPFPLWRIDYVFHSAGLAVLDAHMGAFGQSDHRPVVARLGFK